jgi:hypothetical protein
VCNARVGVNTHSSRVSRTMTCRGTIGRCSSFAFVAVLFALVVSAPKFASAIFHVEKANVVVRLPTAVAGAYAMAIANFGSPIYGATLSYVPICSPFADFPLSRDASSLCLARSQPQTPIPRPRHPPTPFPPPI